MNTDHRPRGAIRVLLQRMGAEPARIFSSAECAAILECSQKAVSPTLLYAVKAQRVFKRTVGRCCEYSASPMPGVVVLPRAKKRTTDPTKAKPLPVGWLTPKDDPRIGKVVPGWKPPEMVHVRGFA